MRARRLGNVKSEFFENPSSVAVSSDVLMVANLNETVLSRGGLFTLATVPLRNALRF